jgi:hypothetical protein
MSDGWMTWQLAEEKEEELAEERLSGTGKRILWPTIAS